jgi:hypothetical protein
MRVKKDQVLTIKQQAVIEGKMRGLTDQDVGLAVFNTSSPRNAGTMARAVLNKEHVKNEIERRMAAQEIYVDRHLKNINRLAFTAEKEDVRLRASQDLADRAGIHYKYFADEGKVNVQVDLSDEKFDSILKKYANPPIEAEST